MKKKLVALLLAMSILVTMFSVIPPTESSQAAAKPSLKKKEIHLLVGKKATLKIKKRPSKSTVTYKSAKKKIATVTKKGVVKGKKKGNTTVTATVKKGTKKYRLKAKIMVHTKAKSVGIYDTNGAVVKELNLTVGDVVSLKTKVKPASSNDFITWSVDDERMMSITQKGKLTAIMHGEGLVTVTTLSKKTATVYVTITGKQLPIVDEEEPVPAKPEVSLHTAEYSQATSKYANVATELTTEPLYKLYEKYFKIGTAINGTSPDNSTLASPEMSALVKHHFNSLTYSNMMKPTSLLDQSASKANIVAGKSAPAVRFDSIVDGLEFCKANNMKMRGHVLIWYNQTPDWFFRIGYDSSNGYVNRETMLYRMKSYIRQVFKFCETYYPGVIYSFDIVNEAIDDNGGLRDCPWREFIGDDYVEQAFTFARQYAPATMKLIYNDYNSFDTRKNADIMNLLRPLAEKKLLDGVGMQGYMLADWPSMSTVEKAIRNFASLGLEVQITELTIRPNKGSDYKPSNSEAEMKNQGERYQALFETLLKLDTDNGGPANITSVTFFGLMDHYMMYTPDTWGGQEEYSRLFDENLNRKPSMAGVIAALNKVQ